MKKSFAAILLTLYMSFSCGVVISLHYCMDRFDSVQLGNVKSDLCGKCGMHKSKANGCCNDEVKIFKIQDDQQVSGHNFKFYIQETQFSKTPVYIDNFLSGIRVARVVNDHSPPLSKQDTFLQNCVFRI